MKRVTVFSLAALSLLCAAGCSSAPSPSDTAHTAADDSVLMFKISDASASDTSASSSAHAPAKRVSSTRRGLRYEAAYSPADTQMTASHSDQEVAGVLNSVFKVVASSVKSGQWDLAPAADTSAFQSKP